MTSKSCGTKALTPIFGNFTYETYINISNLIFHALALQFLMLKMQCKKENNSNNSNNINNNNKTNNSNNNILEQNIPEFWDDAKGEGMP